MSNRLDPGQARRFVGPDLGPNCLQRSLEDDTSRQGVQSVDVQRPLLTLTTSVKLLISNSDP